MINTELAKLRIAKAKKKQQNNNNIPLKEREEAETDIDSIRHNAKKESTDTLKKNF